MDIKEVNHRKKVSFHTLGCRLNIAETGSIQELFLKNGYEVVDFGESSDVVFLNTCTVTDGADSTCRNLIRKAQRANPEAKIIVAGCYAQVEAETIKEMQGVDLILGNSEKHKILDYLKEDREDEIHVDMTTEFWGAKSGPSDSHTRAFLKVQDGCNYICSYCIIPAARGRARAISIAEAVKDTQALVDQGFKEIVLTGVNIGEYEKSGEKLSDLISKILDVDGLERLRLASIESNTFSEDLLRVLYESPKFMDHFHVPLQSGDDDILKAMRRRYSVSEYAETIYRIKELFPNAGIGADVIVGFPGETERQFLNTMSLMEKLPLTHFHVFPFSSRKGTLAAKMDNQIQHGVKKERVKALTDLGNRKLFDFSSQFLRRSNNVLFEQRVGEYFEGYTTNFLKVRVKTKKDLKNQILPVKFIDVNNESLIGELL